MWGLQIGAAAAAALLAATVSGCGFGAGERDQGTATLTVTREHGSEPMITASVTDPPATETVVRLLDREAEIETSYGGNFVGSIDGVAGTVDAGRSEDWFFYVNGNWSPVGAGEATVKAGDRIWWDYRDWTDAYRVPAVVGSWPEPFLHGLDGERPPTEVVCFDAVAACAEVGRRLSDAGAEVSEVSAGEPGADPARTLRVLVGSWARVRDDDLAATLAEGPATSGVYARPLRCGDGFALATLDERAEVSAVFDRAAWVAAVGGEGQQPTWVVSATEPAGVDDAAALLDAATLADHYAIAASGSQQLRLPTEDGFEGSEASCR